MHNPAYVRNSVTCCGGAAAEKHTRDHACNSYGFSFASSRMHINRNRTACAQIYTWQRKNARRRRQRRNDDNVVDGLPRTDRHFSTCIFRCAVFCCWCVDFCVGVDVGGVCVVVCHVVGECVCEFRPWKQLAGRHIRIATCARYGWDSVFNFAPAQTGFRFRSRLDARQNAMR